MTVRFIRAQKRFGVCRGVRLHTDHGEALSGLLIEVSLEGCRVSNVPPNSLLIGDRVRFEVDASQQMVGHVIWQHDGLMGLRLARPLHNAELADLIHICRGDAVAPAQRA